MVSDFQKLPDDPDAFSDVELPLDPSVRTGLLENNMRYYVARASKPKDRVALALAVSVGSLAEEDPEQGVAHILEHLAFNATEKYSNHDIVRFLESIGAEFGACQNAHTSFDETVYELLVPTQDLGKALSVFSEFATKIRCDPEDLRKERGAVLDEWRGTRSVEGRAAEAEWKIMCQGSKYAERLPIGLEGVIRNVPAATIKAFYDRFYTPDNMAVVVVGDLPDLDATVASVAEVMGVCQPHSQQPRPSIPRAVVPPHEEPRYHAYVDRESQQASVMACFLREPPRLKSCQDLKDVMTEELFMTALNNRLFRISRRDNPPFYVAEMSSGVLAKTVQNAQIAASVEDNGHSRALNALLTELARIRQHGLTEQEITAARLQQMSEAESMYRERNQIYSTDQRDELVRHYLNGELVVGKEKETRLTKTLLPSITGQDLLQVAQRFKPSCSCMVKAASAKKAISVAELREVVESVDRQEREGAIPPWQDQAQAPPVIPEGEVPAPGEILPGCKDFPYLGAKEVTLANGMRVCYKRTDFLGDQVLINATAQGGLSEVPREHFRSCSNALRLVNEIGQYGHRPEVVTEMMMGKRVELSLSVSAYSRSFQGEQSPVDLDTCFQLLYRLFTHQVKPTDSNLATCLKYMRESIANEVRSPYKRFMERVRFINYNRNYFYEPMTLKELDKIDPGLACQYFNDCFRNPAQFTLCVVGSIEEETFLPLLEQYLASIPACDHPPVMRADQITALPHNFPTGVVVEDVSTSMVAPQGMALITIPINLPFEDGLVDQGKILTVVLGSTLLETRLMRLLRFQFGEVYNTKNSERRRQTERTQRPNCSRRMPHSPQRHTATSRRGVPRSTSS